MFKDPPPLATLCTIEGFDNNSSEEVKNHVASIIKEGSIFNVDEIDEQDGDYILKIKSLSKLLAEQTWWHFHFEKFLKFLKKKRI